MKKYKKTLNLKNYKNKILAVLMAASLTMITTGCDNEMNSLTYLDSTNNISSEEVIDNLLENNELNIRSNYDFNDSKLCKLGDIAVLKVGKFDENNNLDYGFIDPFTGEVVIKLGCTNIINSYENNNKVLKITYEDGTEETLYASNLKNIKDSESESEITETVEDEIVVAKTTEDSDALKRSKQIQKSEDPLVEMYNVYDSIGAEFTSSNGNIYRKVSIIGDQGFEPGYFNMNTLTEDISCKKYNSIGAEFTTSNGNIYRKVSIPGDEGYAYGYFNMNTLKEDIPCKKYDSIGAEFTTSNGNIYRKVSIPGDEGYAYGYFNMNTLKEDIPCKKYDSIGAEFTTSNGNIYRKVSIIGDEGYAYGYFNMNTLTEDIPCKTYFSIENVEEGVYQGVTFDGKLKTYRL